MEVIYTIQYKVGSIGGEFTPFDDDLLHYAKEAFRIDDKSHVKLMEKAKEGKVRSFLCVPLFGLISYNFTLFFQRILEIYNSWTNKKPGFKVVEGYNFSCFVSNKESNFTIIRQKLSDKF